MVIRYSPNIRSDLKGLFESLYPGAGQELLRRVDVGSLEYNYHERRVERVNEDGVISNAEIVNFLLKTGHAERLDEIGWRVPILFRRTLPQRLKLPVSTGDLKTDARNLHKYLYDFFGFDRSHTWGCYDEMTAEEAFYKVCHECSEYAYIYKGLAEVMGFGDRVSVTVAGTECLIFDHTFIHVDTEPLLIVDQEFIGTEAEHRAYWHIPDDAHAHYGRMDDSFAMCEYYSNYQRYHNDETAERYADYIVDLCPWFIHSYRARSRFHEKRGDYPEAYRDMLTGHEIYPSVYTQSELNLLRDAHPFFHVAGAFAVMKPFEDDSYSYGPSISLAYGKKSGILAGISLTSMSTGSILSLRAGYRTTLTTYLSFPPHYVLEVFASVGGKIGNNSCSLFGLGASVGIGIVPEIDLTATYEQLFLLYEHAFQVSLGLTFHLPSLLSE